MSDGEAAEDYVEASKESAPEVTVPDGGTVLRGGVRLGKQSAAPGAYGMGGMGGMDGGMGSGGMGSGGMAGGGMGMGWELTPDKVKPTPSSGMMGR